MANNVNNSMVEIHNKYIQIFVHTPMGTTLCLCDKSNSSPRNIKQHIADCIGLSPCSIELNSLKGLKCDDNFSFEEHAVGNEINITARISGVGLLGGADKNPDDDFVPRKVPKLSHTSSSGSGQQDTFIPAVSSAQAPVEDQEMASEIGQFEGVSERMDARPDENQCGNMANKSVRQSAPYTRHSSTIEGDDNQVFQIGDHSQVVVNVNQPSKKRQGMSVARCRRFLEQCYQTRLCKLPQFPGSQSFLNMNDIFTDLSIEIELATPGSILKMPITDYHEMLERKTNNGNRPTRILLVGEGGSGKSTLAAKIAHDWVTEVALKDVSLLFVLNMRKIGHNSSLEDAIFEQLMPKDVGFTKEELHTYIDQNQAKVMFILDSYDEFNRKESLQDEPTTNVIEALSYNELVICTVVVTSRPWKANDFSDFKREYTKFEVKGFTSDQVETYIGNFFGNDTDMAKSLLNYLKVNNFCPGIACVPLMALLFCMFWKDNKSKDIPKRIGQLYTSIIKTLVAHQKSKNTDSRVLLHETLKTLGRIAFKGLWPPGNTLSFPQPEIEDFVSNDIVDMALRVGIFVVDEDLSQETPCMDSNSIFDPCSEASTIKARHLRFFHKTIQEKCAGEFLAGLAREHPDEVETHLQVLSSVKLCLRVKWILQFACGVNQEVTALIIAHLQEIFNSHIRDLLPKYYRDELEEIQVKDVQQFMELCLVCNYESGFGGKFNTFFIDLFPNGKMRFLGMSAYMTMAIGYFLTCRPSIKSITIFEMPRSGETVYYLPKSKVLGDVHKSIHKALNQEDGNKLRKMFDEFVEKGMISKSSANICNALGDVSVWETFADWQPSSAIDLTSVFGALRYVKLSTLDITDVKLNSQCETLISCIESGCLLAAVTLMLRQIGLDQNEVSRLVSAMCNNKLPELKVLDISRNQAGIPVRLGEALMALQMTNINVSFMTKNLTDVSEFIGKLPKYGPNLQEFRIEGNPTNERVGQVLSSALPHALQLRNLGIADISEMESDSHQRMLMGLGRLKYLQELRIWDITTYLDHVLMCVANALPSLPSLNYLSLRRVLRAEDRPSSSPPTLNQLIDALGSAHSMRKLLLLGIYFEQHLFQKVLDIGREYDYELFCVFRKMLPNDANIPEDDFIQLY